MSSATLSEASGRPLPAGQSSVWDSLQTSALTWKDRVALVCFHQKADLYEIDLDCSAPYLRWTYENLVIAVERFAGNLVDLGVQPGQSIATFLPNGVEFVITFWAAHKLGCTFVPVNPKTLSNTAETLHILNVANVSAIMVQEASMAAHIDLLSLKLTTRVVVSNRVHGWLSFSELLKPLNVKLTDIGEKSETVTILFTSGTTSLPKGCPHTNETLNASMANLSLGGMSEKDIFCSVLPNNHVMGYFFCLYFFCHGGAVVFPSAKFDAKSMLQALAKESCTHACLVPTALRALLQALALQSIKPGFSLIDVCLAGSPITPENLRQVIHELGSRGVSIGYGMTEGSPVWASRAEDPETLLRGDATLVGTPSPGATIKICAPKSRHPLPRAQQGEVHQAGPGLIYEYVGLKSADFYEADGRRWFVTGDQAIMFDDGLVSITGRYKDMIIRGGENIAPSSIEVILNKFEGLQVIYFCYILNMLTYCRYKLLVLQMLSLARSL